ncbi:transcriptional regulator GntR family [Vibrio variabilis]|uniref:Transcriptional regulator GntR family n=1 Tax=Vibrio variabilis TaxID=990271 RepID=A0ABQ0JET6_9VIBR|nr:transcriptional regulator GntR family [Vibrio variabilis]
MGKFNTISKETVTEKIIRQIADLITSGELQPGEKLPNERELAETFNVTRSRLREALRALSMVGMISIRAGEGSFVTDRRDMPPKDATMWMFHDALDSVEEMFEVRRLIETEVALKAFERFDEAGREMLKSAFEQLSAARAHSIETYMDCIDNFDLVLASQSGNKMYFKLTQTLHLLRRESALNTLRIEGGMEFSFKLRQDILTLLLPVHVRP